MDKAFSSIKRNTDRIGYVRFGWVRICLLFYVKELALSNLNSNIISSVIYHYRKDATDSAVWHSLQRENYEELRVTEVFRREI